MDTKWADGLTFRDGPKYLALKNAILRAVEGGYLVPGNKLPPVRQLAWTLGITPGTVARAYSLLTEDGTLTAGVGRGTFVADTKKAAPEDIWTRQTEPPTEGEVSLFSPLLPDVGQVAAIKSCLARVGDQDANALLRYPTRAAYQPIREAAVRWLAHTPIGAVHHEDLVLTHGGQNGIMLCLQAIVSGPRPTIMVEELSYAGFRRAAEMLRINVVPVPTDENGIVPEALDRVARESGAQVLCTSPEVQNPMAMFTPLERRQEIAKIAERRDFAILEDDCYRMGTAHAQGYRALASDRSWYVTSISKLLTPSMRVGFAVAPKGQGPALRRAAEYGFFGLAWPLAEATKLLLEDPRTDTLIKDVRKVFQSYLEITVNALGQFDLRWQPDVPFVWLELPRGWRSAAFCRAAEQQGIQIRSADEFALRDTRVPQAVRIAINAQVPKERFEQAMRRLHDLLVSPPEVIAV
ncbi:PLP-dependent aminotransferase family protein [Shimia ponticola]|uniref:aminotransferase-like domain-containing protein n=1 Tax=Shimia ponticola TaxID=2582893 RepID=UPI0011BF8032|nr:PLP-dependent aminotransferase family protein [Shimia ponticola]